MKRRIVLWAGAGFLIACCFVLFTFLVSPESLNPILHSSSGKAFAFASCPLVYGLRPHFPIAFWWVPPINALTYAVVGFVAELLRKTLRSPIRLAS